MKAQAAERKRKEKERARMQKQTQEFMDFVRANPDALRKNPFSKTF